MFVVLQVSNHVGLGTTVDVPFCCCCFAAAAPCLFLAAACPLPLTCAKYLSLRLKPIIRPNIIKNKVYKLQPPSFQIKCFPESNKLTLQDAAGLPASMHGTYKYSVADTFLLRGTTERLERYNRQVQHVLHNSRGINTDSTQLYTVISVAAATLHHWWLCHVHCQFTLICVHCCSVWLTCCPACCMIDWPVA